MLEHFKELIVNQYHASLKTLDLCIDKCPDSHWHESIHELSFDQAAFHCLFFTDLYLGQDVASQKEQPFHHRHADVFLDYEELEPRRQTNKYERAWVKSYLEHCRDKATEVMQAEDAESFETEAKFEWQTITRAELHVNNIRHVQHHAAQLILRLRLDHNVEMPWVSSGWGS